MFNVGSLLLNVAFSIFHSRFFILAAQCSILHSLFFMLHVACWNVSCCCLLVWCWVLHLSLRPGERERERESICWRNGFHWLAAREPLCTSWIGICWVVHCLNSLGYQMNCAWLWSTSGFLFLLRYAFDTLCVVLLYVESENCSIMNSLALVSIWREKERERERRHLLSSAFIWIFLYHESTFAFNSIPLAGTNECQPAVECKLGHEVISLD